MEEDEGYKSKSGCLDGSHCTPEPLGTISITLGDGLCIRYIVNLRFCQDYRRLLVATGTVVSFHRLVSNRDVFWTYSNGMVRWSLFVAVSSYHALTGLALPYCTSCCAR